MKSKLIFIGIAIVGSLVVGAGALFLPSSVNMGTIASPEEATSRDTTIPTQAITGPSSVVPSEITDSDPIITCTSKTGQLQVKQSVCSAYTDCPDGYGGFVFESQDSCKARWDAISKNAADVMTKTAQAHIDTYNMQNATNQLNNYATVPVVAIPTPVQFNPSLAVKIIDPTPVPTQAFGGGSLGGSLSH